MKRYKVELTHTAEKELYKLPSGIVEKIVAVLISLEENPRPAGCKKLKGYNNSWRIRIGDYRVIYEVEDKILRILVIAIGHRKDVYE